jgi:hypothetical protein
MRKLKKKASLVTNCRIHILMTENEYNRLSLLVAKLNLDRSKIIRQIIENIVTNHGT